MTQVLKVINRSVIPSIRTNGDAEKLKSIIKDILNDIEEKQTSLLLKTNKSGKETAPILSPNV